VRRLLEESWNKAIAERIIIVTVDEESFFREPLFQVRRLTISPTGQQPVGL
jgi:hypothetical protein